MQVRAVCMQYMFPLHSVCDGILLITWLDGDAYLDINNHFRSPACCNVSATHMLVKHFCHAHQKSSSETDNQPPPQTLDRWTLVRQQIQLARAHLAGMTMVLQVNDWPNSVAPEPAAMLSAIEFCLTHKCCSKLSKTAVLQTLPIDKSDI